MSFVCPISRWAARRPEAIGLIAHGRAWSYREMDAEVDRIARGERGPLSIVCSQNSAELLFGFFAAARTQSLWVPLNSRLTEVERAELVARVVRPSPFVPLPVQGEGVLAVLFTSGTSGCPRGAALSVANFEAASAASASNLGGSADQRWLLCMPMFHIGGLAMVHRVATYGASLVLHERFEVEAVWRSLHDEHVTHLSLVPTQLKWLLECDARPAPGALRAVLVGGGPVGRDVLEVARARGFKVLQTYGLTEACSQVTTERLDEADGTTAGRPLEGIEVRISPEESEIQVRGPTVMRGYFNDPDGTARAFTDDGWFRTGDLGELDHCGRLIVHARRTDLIVSGGENIYPAEVEAVLAAHPELAEAAVFAVPDSTWGQLPAALVVPRARATGGTAVRYPPLPESLSGWCRSRLAGFKVPKRFLQTKALPRTANGKVDRKALAALFNSLTQQMGEPHDERT